MHENCETPAHLSLLGVLPLRELESPSAADLALLNTQDAFCFNRDGTEAEQDGPRDNVLPFRPRPAARSRSVEGGRR